VKGLEHGELVHRRLHVRMDACARTARLLPLQASAIGLSCMASILCI